MGGGSGEGSRYEGYTSTNSAFKDVSSPERPPPSGEAPPAMAVATTGNSGSGPRTQPPIVDADQIFHGVPLFLLRGGVGVDPVPLAPVGSLPTIDDYDWADFDVNTQVSALLPIGLEDFIGRSYIVRDEVDARLIRVAVSHENERVCHGKGSGVEDFFFVYATFLDQLHIRVPFTNFKMGLLRALNVVPTQLHPNAWATVQAFGVVCLAVGVLPTVLAFLYYFDIRPSPKGGGVGVFDFREGSDTVQAILQVLQEL